MGGTGGQCSDINNKPSPETLISQSPKTNYVLNATLLIPNIEVYKQPLLKAWGKIGLEIRERTTNAAIRRHLINQDIGNGVTGY